VKSFFHRTRDQVDVPDVPRRVRPQLRFATVALIVAVIAFAVSGAAGNIHGSLDQKLIGGVGGLVFVVAAIVATRAAAAEVYVVVGARTGPSHAGVLRWLVTIIGYIIVVITALGLFAVPVGHLLLGGALTGVVVGIAAQQSLGNVFAGVVLLLARPFSVGDSIRVRSGSLGGPLEGTVSGMGMTYVTLLTEDGPLSLPNSSLLAAAVGPAPGTSYKRSRPLNFDPPRERTGTRNDASTPTEPITRSEPRFASAERT
jgi:small-conductance mechanosensitive channel